MKTNILPLLAAMVGFGLGPAVTNAVAAPTEIVACEVLTASGSYRVANNLSATGDCLVVAAGATENVTIDLDGFTILGNGTGSGIRGNGVFEGLTVRNGTIKNFDVGLNVYGNTMLIERMQLIRNVSSGLAAVENIMVKDSVFAGNGVGANVGDGSVLIGNAFNFNTSDGLVVSQTGGATIINNSAKRNLGAGFRVQCPSSLVGNTASQNTGGNVVLVGAGCMLAHNVPYRKP